MQRQQGPRRANEEEIYNALGMQPVPPEDIKGILHAHTNRSDGVDSLATMADATRARGYQYFGVADHSKSAHCAGGLNADEVTEQQTEADTLNKKYGGAFCIFKGIESDILADGSLDFPDEILGTFDFAVASVHGRFKLDREVQTDRIIRAVANPYTTILSHMTGRQLLRRPSYTIDIDKVLMACAEYGVAVENQRKSVAARSRLAMAREGLKPRVPHEHKSGRALDPRNRPHALGRRNGAEGWRAEGARAELPPQR